MAKAKRDSIFAKIRETMTVLLEILKITVPALIVFFTVYTLMKQYLEDQYRIKLLESQEKKQKTTLPLRLTAYERLSLFCERTSIPATILRVKTPDMQAAALQIALLLAIQHEYEHNITQQVYVSDDLWKIIKIAKEETLNTVNYVADQVDPKADANVLAKALFDHLQTQEGQPLIIALKGIKREAALLLG